jgi:hypothetical protein
MPLGRALTEDRTPHRLSAALVAALSGWEGGPHVGGSLCTWASSLSPDAQSRSRRGARSPTKQLGCWGRPRAAVE